MSKNIFECTRGFLLVAVASFIIVYIWSLIDGSIPYTTEDLQNILGAIWILTFIGLIGDTIIFYILYKR